MNPNGVAPVHDECWPWYRGVDGHGGPRHTIGGDGHIGQFKLYPNQSMAKKKKHPTRAVVYVTYPKLAGDPRVGGFFVVVCVGGVIAPF